MSKSVFYYKALPKDDIEIEQAKNNTLDNFKFGFEDAFMEKLIARMEQNQDIFPRMMDDKDFGLIVRSYILKKVYNKLNE